MKRFLLKYQDDLKNVKLNMFWILSEIQLKAMIIN